MAFKKNIVYIDDVPSTRFKNLFFKDLPLMPVAIESVDSVRIQGRAENLTKRTGYYNDISITLNGVIVDIFTEIDDKSVLTDIIGWIANGEKLRLSTQPREYAVIEAVTKYEQKRIGSSAAEISITVRCKPFKRAYPDTAFIVIKSSPATISGFGNYFSEPLLEIRGVSSPCTVTLNGVQIKINGVSGTVYIDVENRAIYQVSGSDKNSILDKTSGDIWKFLLYPDRDNSLTFSGCTEIRLTRKARYI